MKVQWLTTAPNPRVVSYTEDAGQRGWRLHAVEAEESETFKDVRERRALCGLLPSHGWGLDFFIEAKCSRWRQPNALGAPLSMSTAESDWRAVWREATGIAVRAGLSRATDWKVLASDLETTKGAKRVKDLRVDRLPGERRRW